MSSWPDLFLLGHCAPQTGPLGSSLPITGWTQPRPSLAFPPTRPLPLTDTPSPWVPPSKASPACSGRAQSSGWRARGPPEGARDPTQEAWGKSDLCLPTPAVPERNTHSNPHFSLAPCKHSPRDLALSFIERSYWSGPVTPLNRARRFLAPHLQLQSVTLAGDRGCPDGQFSSYFTAVWKIF